MAAAAIGFGKEAKPFLTGMLSESQTSFTSILVHMNEGYLVNITSPIKQIKDLLEPILSAIVETDSRLRYFACESLYNVTKVVRTQLIPGRQFWHQRFCKQLF